MHMYSTYKCKTTKFPIVNVEPSCQLLKTTDTLSVLKCYFVRFINKRSGVRKFVINIICWQSITPRLHDQNAGVFWLNKKISWDI